MNVLLVWPVFPKSYWSFERVLELVGKKALVPPLGVVTVAAMLPQEWNFRLVDKNVRDLTEDDWAWADVVMLSAMIVQKDDYAATIAEAKRRGLPSVVGGPYATSVPEDAEAAGADYIVMDEGEITIPMFLKDFTANPSWRRGEGEAARRYTAAGAKPEMQETPVARFDLLDLPAYDMMCIQYSRGCPFLCEFCDIITLYGRVPRTKPNDKVLAELQQLYDLGWRSGVFLVDDNFIGNKKNVKSLLHDLRDWNHDHGRPFYFQTEASIDLAADEELLDLMMDCGFDAVFLGIETPDVDSLEITRKHQNNRGSMSESVARIQRKGMRVMAGFIIGFDGEKKGAGQRIVQFAEETNITHALLSMLQVLPNTGLYTRLKNEGRLQDGLGTLNQTTILNFVPTRPVAEITREFLDAMDALYDPVNYMNRVCRFVLELGQDRPPAYRGGTPAQAAPRGKTTWADRKDQIRLYRSALALIWRQGVARTSRKVFWRHLWSLSRTRSGAVTEFLILCAHNEHFLELTRLSRRSLEAQLAAASDEVHVPAPPKPGRGRKRAPAVTSHMSAG